MGNCVTIILETRVQVTESAKSTVPRILITDYFMQKELLCVENHNTEVQTEQVLYHQWRTTKQKKACQESRGGNGNANQTHLSQESETSQITDGDACTHTATMEAAQMHEKVVFLQRRLRRLVEE